MWRQFLYLDTPYSKYSNTNYAVSGKDVHAITEIISQRQAQLDNVTTELALVESIMERVRSIHQQLLDKRNQVVVSMQAHQGLVSCIRRLPAEILGEIFLRCLPPDPPVEPDTTAAPLLLLAVCRRWRKVALGTPRLWCSLSIRPSHRIQQQGVFYYHHWLSRARCCPLSLAVDTRRPPMNPVWRYEVTELLQPYMSRAARLRIAFDDATAPDLLLKDASMLEHLTLDGDLRTARKMALIQPVLRLRSLTLNTLTLALGDLSAFNPGWAHLTQLRVTLGRGRSLREATDGPIVLALLALCPHLEEFSFSPFFVSRYDAPRAFTHARLRSLDVVVLSGVGPLLEALTLPALRQLTIRDLDILPSTWRHNAFTAFLKRSCCPLETLKIHGTQVAISKADRQEYAALIPTLKQLDLCLAVMMHS